MRLRSGAATDVGRVREHNEDSVLAEGTVWAVADGMGGHAAGEVASAIATATLAELAHVEPRTVQHLSDALATANERILESELRHPEQTGMATTVTGLTLVSDEGSQRWAVFNIGDSRVYRFAEGDLSQVTVDHSEVQELVDEGVITAEEALRHPLRNLVTRALGTETASTADVWVLSPRPAERFILCSDGLSNELGFEDIRRIVAEVDDPQAAAEALVRAAVDAGGQDNVSVVVVALDG